MGGEQSRNTRAGISGLRTLLPSLESVLPQELLELLRLTGRIAEEASAAAFVVGGAVRDALLGRQSLDIDVVVEGDAMRVVDGLTPYAVKKPVLNPAFGTATVPLRDGFHIDVATARTETYKAPGALPEVENASINEDLRRRDFTINCVAASLDPSGFGSIIDPLQGLKDIEIGLIRILHDGSFVDDPTRIVRGIKYANRFRFAYDDRTLELAEEAIWDGCFKTISPHRLTDELRILFVEEMPWAAIWDVAQFGVLSSLSPFLSLLHNGLEVLQRIEAAEAALVECLPGGYRKWIVRLLMFMAAVPGAELANTLALFDVDKGETGIVERFVLEKKRLLAELDAASDLRSSSIYKLFHGFPAEASLAIAAIHGKKPGNEALERYWEHLSRASLEITGEDLIRLGIERGPMIGEILDKVLMAKLDGEVGGREEELALVCRLRDW